MSICSHAHIEQKVSFIGPEAGFGDNIHTPNPSDAGDLFTRQTGQVLLALGNMFLYIPPFNEHVDRKTAHLLISIGNKLKAVERS